MNTQASRKQLQIASPLILLGHLPAATRAIRLACNLHGMARANGAWAGGALHAAFGLAANRAVVGHEKYSHPTTSNIGMPNQGSQNFAPSSLSHARLSP
jgi:hypothetical protein